MIYACPSCGRANHIPTARLNARARCAECKTQFLPLDRPYDVLDADTFDELVHNSPLPIVVDFWASWCGPCLSVAPEIKKLAASEAGRVVILKVDAEALSEVANRYNIRAIPTFIRFDQGRETRRATGALPGPALASALGLSMAPAPQPSAHP